MTDHPPDKDRPSSLARGDGATIAYHRSQAREDRAAAPGVIFLGGYRADMTGTKAMMLESQCRDAGLGFVRFDYFGHGQSSGEFTDGTIGRWGEDALAVLDELTDGPQVLVGSSMGGWIMLLAALARPHRIAGLVGIAAAPDFTEDLMWQRFPDEIKEVLRRDGVYLEPSQYDPEPTPITLRMIEEGRAHLLLDRPIAFHEPVRLIHGMKDPDVPWITAPTLAGQLLSEDVSVKLIKGGDHRLSRDEDLAIIWDTVESLCRLAEEEGF